MHLLRRGPCRPFRRSPVARLIVPALCMSALTLMGICFDFGARLRRVDGLSRFATSPDPSLDKEIHR